LLETEGHDTQLGLRAFRPIISARKIAADNESQINLSIEGDQINIPIGPYQMIDVEVFFPNGGQ